MNLYDLLSSVLGFPGSGVNEIISAGCVAFLLLFSIITIDLIYKLFLRFLPNNLR